MAAAVLFPQGGLARSGALRKLDEEFAAMVEESRGDGEVVPVLVEPLDEPWVSYGWQKLPSTSSVAYPWTNGIVPSGTAFGITSRPARRSGRYTLRSRSRMPIGACSTRPAALRHPTYRS